MNKKWICWLAIVAFVLTILPGTALAAGNDTAQFASSTQLCARTRWNAKQSQKLSNMVAQANREIEALVRKAQQTRRNDVPQLLRQVDKIVRRVFAYANSIGAVLECEYVEYWIDGQSVLIDPIRIVRL